MTRASDLYTNEYLGIRALIGSADRELVGVSQLGAVAPGQLAFAGDRMDSETMKAAVASRSGFTVICRAELAVDLAGDNDVTILVSDNPRLSFMRAVGEYFLSPSPVPGIHPAATIHPTAMVAPSAHVGPGCVIGADCVVDDKSILHPNVTLYWGVRVGKGCVIHSGTVVGADGFGYERNEDGVLEKFPHLGGVVIGENVEIGSNVSIDRGTLGDTVIMENVRIDNQVHIAHNVFVGRDSAIIAQAMIGGSVKIGERAWIAPSAVIMNQVMIGADATVGLGAVVTKDVAEGQTVMGSPAQDGAEFKATRAAIKRLTNG